MLGLSVGNLADCDAAQLVLPFERSDTVVAAVRERFGRTALQRAITMRGDPGIQLRMPPTEMSRLTRHSVTFPD